jgi:hypothetical protein
MDWVYWVLATVLVLAFLVGLARDSYKLVHALAESRGYSMSPIKAGLIAALISSFCRSL